MSHAIGPVAMPAVSAQGAVKVKLCLAVLGVVSACACSAMTMALGS